MEKLLISKIVMDKAREDVNNSLELRRLWKEFGSPLDLTEFVKREDVRVLVEKLDPSIKENL